MRPGTAGPPQPPYHDHRQAALMNSDRVPSLPLPLPSQQHPKTLPSRVSSISSTASKTAASHHSHSSSACSSASRTPSPSALPTGVSTGPPIAAVSYDAMNQATDIYYPQHLSAHQTPHPQAVSSGAMTHYQQLHQPPLLQPGQAHYSTPSQYSQYGYSNGLTSPPASQPMSTALAHPQNVLPLPGVPVASPMTGRYTGFDTTGQQPPPGMKPRVTATLWEDEGSLCFQVEARGICVARREDNHMINGTKLLNVAGMTRGRRDGILKSEKIRHVVKIGPMHLKGVWIPFERALDFANKEKITEMLYPLFVHNIGNLLYHPTNQNRTTQVMATAERRKQEHSAAALRNPAQPGLPSIQQHHHHSMVLHAGGINRPPMDRAHTFPTPPASASSVLTGIGGASNSFSWQPQALNSTQAFFICFRNIFPSTKSFQELIRDAGTTTPPGTFLPTVSSYPSAPQGYDGTRPIYGPASTQSSPYQSSADASQERLYSQAPTYIKNEMGPPPAHRPSVGGTPAESHETKLPNGILTSEPAPPHPVGEEEPDHEQEAEYTHDSASYDTSGGSYNYTDPSVGSLAQDGHIPADMTGSPNHPPTSGRATPRTTAPHQPYYPQHSTGYSIPPRVQSSSLYSVMTTDRPPAASSQTSEVYAASADLSGSMTNGYAPQAPVLNGSATGLKRAREDDLSRSSSDGHTSLECMDGKRRKTIESGVTMPSYDVLSRPDSAIATSQRR